MIKNFAGLDSVFQLSNASLRNTEPRCVSSVRQSSLTTIKQAEH